MINFRCNVNLKLQEIFWRFDGILSFRWNKEMIEKTGIKVYAASWSQIKCFQAVGSMVCNPYLVPINFKVAESHG